MSIKYKVLNTEMAEKLKFHKTINVAKTETLPKMKYYQN